MAESSNIIPIKLVKSEFPIDPHSKHVDGNDNDDGAEGKRKRGRPKVHFNAQIFNGIVDDPNAVNVLIFKIVRLLNDERRSMMADEIEERININIIDHPTLLRELAQNPRVFCHPNHVFSYQPIFFVHTIKDLLTYIQAFPYGIKKSVFIEEKVPEEWFKSLETDKKISVIRVRDEQYLFPNPEQYRSLRIEKEFVEKWKAIKPPDGLDLDPTGRFITDLKRPRIF